MVLPGISSAQVAPAAAAAPGFSIGAGLQSQYDSNVVRAPTDAGNGSWINQADAIAGFDRTYGRQHVYATADVGRVLYDQLSVYNYTHEALHGGWHMDLLDSANSEVDLTRTLDLAHFADLNSVRRNVISRDAAHVSVDYPVATVWRPIVGADAARLRNSNGVDSPADVNTSEVDGGIRYQTGKENQVDLVARMVRGSYPNPQPVPAQVSSYREKGGDLRVKWKFSASSTLFGRVGYVERTNDLPAFRNFSGAAYDMTYVWQPTGRTTLTALVLRQTGATGDNQYLSSVTHLYSLTPAYAVTAKTRVEAQFGLSQLDFIVVGNAPPRNDSIYSAALRVAWSPLRWLQVKVGQTWEQRVSNQQAFDYLDRISSILLQASF